VTTTNRLLPLRFVLAFGVVSGLADVVYEGARAIVGPFLANLGASALIVGFVTGVGEAVALVLRLGTGWLSDRTGRHWALSIAGYVVTVAAVPPLALAHTLWQAAVLVIAERFGKAVRTPARDTMLAQASSQTGRGRAFALHEALDQSGALVGPLVVAAMVAISGYRLGFGVLVVPAVATLVLLVWLRWAVPNPGAYEDCSPDPVAAAATGQRFSARFWAYTAFTAMTMLGYATFGVLSYHLQVRHILPEPLIPVLYAVAMGVDALAALASGAIYDRIGLRGAGRRSRVPVVLVVGRAGLGGRGRVGGRDGRARVDHARSRRRYGPGRPPRSRLRHLHCGLRAGMAGWWHDPGSPL
jgi:hypothetical protein